MIASAKMPISASGRETGIDPGRSLPLSANPRHPPAPGRGRRAPAARQTRPGTAKAACQPSVAASDGGHARGRRGPQIAPHPVPAEIAPQPPGVGHQHRPADRMVDRREHPEHEKPDREAGLGRRGRNARGMQARSRRRTPPADCAGQTARTASPSAGRTARRRRKPRSRARSAPP